MRALKPIIMKSNFYSLLPALLLGLNVLAGDSTRVKVPQSYLKDVISVTAKKEGKATLDLFVMSFCPYGINAEKTLLPAIMKEMGDSIAFHIYFVAEEAPDKSFQSLHGESEVMEDRRQLVIARHFPEQLLDYLQDRILNTKDDWAKSAGAACLDANTINELLFKNEEIQAFRDNLLVGNGRKNIRFAFIIHK